MFGTLASGGLWTVAIVSALALGYARAFNTGKRGYLAVLGLAALVIAASQFLPESNVFRTEVRGDLLFLFWLAVLAIPVLGYALLVRWAKRNAKSPGEGNGPEGT